MRLLIGQPEAMPARSVPVWQKGTPQSMQREPCVRSRSSSMWRWNSFQSTVRFAGSRSTGSSRLNSMNPVGLPMSLQLSVLIAADARGVLCVHLEGRHLGLVLGETHRTDLVLGLQRPLEIVRQHLDPARDQRVPKRSEEHTSELQSPYVI